MPLTVCLTFEADDLAIWQEFADLYGMPLEAAIEAGMEGLLATTATAETFNASTRRQRQAKAIAAVRLARQREGLCACGAPRGMRLSGEPALCCERCLKRARKHQPEALSA
jgi:hypothetical protein